MYQTWQTNANANAKLLHTLGTSQTSPPAVPWKSSLEPSQPVRVSAPHANITSIKALAPSEKKAGGGKRALN